MAGDDRRDDEVLAHSLVVVVTLSADGVTGPDCRNWYGPELGAITRTLTGPLTLDIVPDGPLAVVQETEDVSRRYVLTERVLIYRHSQ